MKKHFLLFVFILSIASAKIYAQAGSQGYTLRQLSDMVGQLEWHKAIGSGGSDIAGTPYQNDEYQPGDVYYDGKYKVEKLPLRLNLYNDEFEYRDKNATMAFAKPGRIDKIVIGEEVYIYLEKKSGTKVSGFVRMWNAKVPAVITKMEVEFMRKEEAKPYVDPKPDRFERGHDKHYIMKSESEIEKITSVKKLIKFLGDHSSELTNYSKEEKISTSDEVELAKLVDYYHTL